MKAKRTIAMLLVAAGASQTMAEVSTTSANATNSVVQIGRTDAAPAEVWNQVRSVPPSMLLNAPGAVRGDHSPAIGINPQTGLPEVVWCYWDGTDTDIAWSRFDGVTWTVAELVTMNADDDRMPRIAFAADGATAVSWESHGSIIRVEYRERQLNGTWSPVIHVSDESADACSPAVTEHEARIRIAYVQPFSGSEKAVKIAGAGETSDPWPGYFTPEIIALISFSGDIAPELHSYPNPNRLFTTWVNSATEIGFSRFDGTTWQTPQLEPYTSPEDLPKARIRAKTRALQNP